MVVALRHNERPFTWTGNQHGSSWCFRKLKSNEFVGPSTEIADLQFNSSDTMCHHFAMASKKERNGAFSVKNAMDDLRNNSLCQICVEF